MKRPLLRRKRRKKKQRRNNFFFFMKLIVGLGNPGKEYEGTRHNIGFAVVDELAHVYELVFKLERSFFYSSFRIGSEHVQLIKPLTYMNLSGEAVLKAAKKHVNFSTKDLLVIADDIHLEFETIRFREKGTAGGHNGLKSVIEKLGTNEFCRLRIGIDGSGLSGEALTSHVLSRFKKSEQETLPSLCVKAKNACVDWVCEGPKFVMNRYNRAD